MNTPLDHARHNKEACEHLFAANKFPDWVVTTAFYCAMHYANAIIFPHTEGDDSFRSLEEYFHHRKKIGDTKHSLMLALLRRLHFPISEKYKQLKDTAHTSRYQDYEIHPEVVKKMRRNLTSIEEYCEKKCQEKNPPPDTPEVVA